MLLLPKNFGLFCRINVFLFTSAGQYVALFRKDEFIEEVPKAKSTQTVRGMLAKYAEVISYNKKNLERELQNESRQHNELESKIKRRKEEIL